MKAQYRFIRDNVDEDMIRMYVRPIEQKRDLTGWHLVGLPDNSVVEDMLSEFDMEVLRYHRELIVDGEFQVGGD